MRSLVFQVNPIQFVLPLLVVAAHAAVDVFILDKNTYPNDTFTLGHLERIGGIYPKIIGKAFVAVQAKIQIDENTAKITWANTVVRSQQVPDWVAVVNLGPNYKNAFFVLATSPDIDGRRSFIILPTDVTAEGVKDVQIEVTLEKLKKDELNLLNEINIFQISQKNSQNGYAAPLLQVGEEISRGNCGVIYSVKDAHESLVGKDLVMKTCEANKPGTVVSLEDWEAIDFYEKINRNDYRIGQLLNSCNQETNKIGPIYYTEGRIEIAGKHCYYFTMEKIIGKCIDDDFKNARLLDHSKFAQMFLGMLNAIIRLHKAGVLHRDLHEGNFMKLEGSEEYVIIDHGTSRIAVEWENHIKQNRTILTQGSGMFHPLRADFHLGTDFHDELDMLVFRGLKEYIDNEFFYDNTESNLIGHKIKVLVSNWLEWPHVKRNLKNVTDYLAENLNDMLFLSPTLLHCIHNQKLDQSQLKLSLKAMDDQLFPKTVDPVIEYEFNSSGYLKQTVLPAVEDRYKWPKYDEYETALSNIEGERGGKRHPRDNSSETA